AVGLTAVGAAAAHHRGPHAHTNSRQRSAPGDPLGLVHWGIFAGRASERVSFFARRAARETSRPSEAARLTLARGDSYPRPVVEPRSSGAPENCSRLAA